MRIFDSNTYHVLDVTNTVIVDNNMKLRYFLPKYYQVASVW